jgi:ribosomal protein S12 methylthiotransferase accessory factor YcaO
LLLKAASRFVRVFQLAAPDAPGLIALGGEFDPAIADALHAGSPLIGVSGVGLSLQEAFQGCIGEGIEYLSQLQTDSDVLLPSGSGDPATRLGSQARDFLAAFSAHRLHPDAELSWHPCHPTNRSLRGLTAGRPVPAPAAGPARDHATISAEYRIGHRHVLGCCGLAPHA